MRGEGADPAPLRLANEFAEIVVRKIETRNGERLMISAPRSQRSILLCPVELEALTWQTPDVFSAMISLPGSPMIGEDGMIREDEE